MHYSNMSMNHQRLHIAAFGHGELVTPDACDFRKAMTFEDIVFDARVCDDLAKGMLRFATFLKAVKRAGLKPAHIVEWLSRSNGGREAIAIFAENELGMKSAT